MLKGRGDWPRTRMRQSLRQWLHPTGRLRSVAKDRVGHLPQILADMPDVHDLRHIDVGHARKRGGTVPDPAGSVSQHHDVTDISTAQALSGRLCVDSVKEGLGIFQPDGKVLSWTGCLCGRALTVRRGCERRCSRRGSICPSPSPQCIGAAVCAWWTTCVRFGCPGCSEPRSCGFQGHRGFGSCGALSAGRGGRCSLARRASGHGVCRAPIGGCGVGDGDRNRH